MTKSGMKNQKSTVREESAHILMQSNTTISSMKPVSCYLGIIY
jgi:hypothetical protein